MQTADSIVLLFFVLGLVLAVLAITVPSLAETLGRMRTLSLPNRTKTGLRFMNQTPIPAPACIVVGTLAACALLMGALAAINDSGQQIIALFAVVLFLLAGLIAGAAFRRSKPAMSVTPEGA